MKNMFNHSRGWHLKIEMVCISLLLFCFTQSGNAQFGGNATANKPKIIYQIDIRITGDRQDFWNSVAGDLIQIKPLDLYEFDLLEKAIGRLSDSNLFQSIHVPDPEKTVRGVKLIFELVPHERIKDIRIYSAFPLFNREVVNVMTIYTGDTFSRSKLEEQADRVTTLFKRQGFIDPKAIVSYSKDEADGNYEVTVHIEKGEYLRVNRVEIRGNTRVSSFRLKLRTKTWRASVLFGSAKRFIKKDLKEDIKNVIHFYRKKGFADVAVRGEAVEDINGKQVNIIFHVEEGPQYKVVFQGNENFWDYTLKKEMTLSKDGNKNNFALRKSVRNLKQKYAQKGYPDTRITPLITHRIEENDPLKVPLKQVILAIDEGDQYRVFKLGITGNLTISENEILKSMLTLEPGFGNKGIYVPKILEDDINAIRSLYLRQGFTQTQVIKQVRVLDPLDKDKTNHKWVEISLAIDEGIQTRVKRVQFEGLSVLTRETAQGLISLKPGQPFRNYMMENDINSLTQKISELGYPHIRVTGTKEFSPDRSNVQLTYTVEKGPHVKVGQLFYGGNFRTKTKILNNEMKLFEGDPVSLTKLLESRRNITDMNAIDSVRLRPVGLKNRAEEVDIIVEIEETKPYFFEMGAGYDTQRHFYLNSAVGDHNFAGRNWDLKLEGEISQIGYNGSLSLKNPRFFSTRFISNTRVFGEKLEEFNKDFGIESYGVSQDFFKQYLSKTLTLNLGLIYESRNQYLKQNRPLIPDEAEQYQPRHILMASPGITYQTTDSFVRPTKGTFSTFDVDVSKGIDNDLDDFIKYQLETRYYYSLFEPLVLALRGQYGFIQPYGSSKFVPEDQLFFLGGTSSVRGFDENLLRYDWAGQAVGGQEAILGSFEARYDLGLNVELSAFYDIGSIRRAQSIVGSDEFRDSVGLGLRYMTPIGPIGFLYGWKLDPRPNESSGRFHFSMGYTF
jgi:outer membrane protein insertion porin family